MDQKQLVYPTSYYIALGTNVGNYRNNLSKALVELGKIGHVAKVAHIYKSKPYGYLKQNFFYNSMVCLKSEMLPNQLINKTDLGKPSSLVIANIIIKKTAIVILEAFTTLIKSFIDAYLHIPL